MMHVAIGIITNGKTEVLIAKRPPGTYKSGLWEFPGGKVEANETAFQALQRELKEEVGIDVLAAEAWLQFPHHYGDREVLLDVWKVTQFSSEPRGCEGQEIQWVAMDALTQFNFPDGNRRILERLIDMPSPL